MKWPAQFIFVWLLAAGVCLATSGDPPAREGEYMVNVWRSEDGLPQNSITSIVQTPDGYMWLGTFDGLVRFDGMRFTVFDAVNTPELRSSRIVRLSTDRQGRLWSESQEGDVTMLFQGTFTHVNGDLGLPAMKLGVLGTDPSGDVWAKSNPGGPLYRMKGGRFVPAGTYQTLALTNLSSLVADRLANLWEKVNGDWMPVSYSAERIDDRIEPLKSGILMAGPGRDGNVWFATSEGLHELHRDKWVRATAFPMGSGSGTGLLEDRNGNVWMGTWGAGLLRFGPDGTIRTLDLSQSPQPMSVRAIYEDDEGNLWIGLDGGGLCRMRRRVFQTFGVAQGLRGYLTRAAVEDSSGTFWVVDTGSIDWLHPGGKPLIENSGFQMGTAWCALPGEDNDVWVGSRSGKVFHCRRNGIEPWPVAGGAPVTCAVLFTDREGTLWMGAETGLWRREGPAFQFVPPPAGLTGMDVRAMTSDKTGRVYVGLNGGGLLTYRNGEWTRIGAEEGSPIRRAWALFTDADDTIWIGGYGAGLFRLQGGKLFHFGDPNLGLPRAIASILEDDLGYFWLGSNEGIFRVSRGELNEYADGTRKSVSSIQFGRSDGLETTECASGSQPVAWKGRDGRLWFSTVRGVSVVDPKDLQLNPREPPVAIEEVAADDEIYSPYHSGPGSPAARYDRRRDLVIPAGTDRLEFHFTALTYSAPAKARFRYRLEAFDQEWVGADTRRTATYTHVPHGSYSFHVIACNNDGVWNELGATQAIIVLPRYYQTWWFKLLAAGTALGLIGIAYHLRLQQLKALSRLRLRIASDLHDEVGSNLGSIALNSEMLQGNPALSEDDRRELGEIKRVALQTTQTIREITWLINPGFDTLPEMTGRMKVVAASMLTGRQYEFTALDTMASRKLSLEFRRHVFLIFKEILHNIVKHSRAARVEIRLGEQAGRFELFVRDDGRGFDEASVRHGHGLASLRRRAAALGGVIEIKSQAGRGTTVYLAARIK